ncbi:MAG: hypothetical protein K5761_01635, partial [Clostridiales bacterium]|nr:hypothetical protein [Clostridiales bacterium]
VKFETPNGTTTVLDFIYEQIQGAVSESVFSRFNISKDLISRFISEDIVDSSVKEAVLGCVDYYLYTDYKEAQKRIDTHTEVSHDSVSIADFSDPDSLIKAYVSNTMYSFVENYTEKSSEELVVLISEHTQHILTAVAVISGILLLAVCCMTSIFKSLLFFGTGSLIYGIVIKICQLRFESVQTDKSLIGYVLLEPLADSYSVNANVGIIAGILLIGVFVAFAFLIPGKSKEEKSLTIE